MKISERYIAASQQQNLAITDAAYAGDFVIRITFKDGQEKLVGFKPFLEQANHPAIRKYLDEEQFRQFRIRDGNLDWNDFDLCFPLEDLYLNAILKKEKTT